MLLRFSEPEKVVTAGNLSIGFNISPEALHILITDDNPHFREAQVEEARWKQVGSRHMDYSRHMEYNKACLFPKEFIILLENKGVLLEDVLCPPEPVPVPCPPEPCPPDPCHQDVRTESNRQSDLRNRQNPYTGVHVEEAHNQPGEPSASGKRFIPDSIEVWGFDPIGDIDRTRFHKVIYRLSIPQEEFTELYNRLEIYLNDESGIPSLLLSTALEKVDTLPGEDEQTPTWDDLDKKADRTDIDSLQSRIDELDRKIDEWIRNWQQAQIPPQDTAHKTSHRGRTST